MWEITSTHFDQLVEYERVLEYSLHRLDEYGPHVEARHLALQRLDALLQQPVHLRRRLVLLQQLLGLVVVDAVLGVGALHGRRVIEEAATEALVVLLLGGVVPVGL